MASFSWKVAPEVVAPVDPVVTTQTPTRRESSLVRGRRGLLRPLRRDGVSSFATGSGEALDKSRLGQLLGTRRGECAWRPEFGSRLHLLLHSRNDAVTAELARFYAMEAVEQWMPHIRITGARVERRADDYGNLTVLAVSISYERLASRTRQVLSRDELEFIPKRAA